MEATPGGGANRKAKTKDPIDLDNEIEAEDQDARAVKLSLCDASLVDTETSWDSMGLDQRLLKAISRLQYKNPTLVQAKGIPLALKGKDILARAKTGSGKTAAYLLPVLQKILNKKERDGENAVGVKAVIIVPTKELCQQLKEAVDSLGYYCKKWITSLQLASTGPLSAQQSQLKENPDIVISTPSRLVAHLKAKNISLKDTLEMVVVDEADLILSFGYEDDMKAIADALPPLCQGFLMSATLTPEVDGLKQLVLHTPAVLKLEEAEKDATENLVQYSIKCKDSDKFLISYVLVRLGLVKGKLIFFVNDIDRGYRLKLFFERFGIRAAVLNSELPLNSRLHILQEFNKGLFDYLIASDESMTEGGSKQVNDYAESSAVEVIDADDPEQTDPKKQKNKRKKAPAAARDAQYGVSRGVDFHHVDAVLNFDFPPNPEAYTHRVGRTARAGESGIAISFVSPEEEPLLSTVVQFQKDHNKAVKPYEFKLSIVEGFRYRVEDVLKSVTRVAVREARAEELKKEILNSEKLRAHFEDNPRDLQLLKHESALQEKHIQSHLKHVPQYLMPNGAKPVGHSRKRQQSAAADTQVGKKKKSDPLQTFSAAPGKVHKGPTMKGRLPKPQVPASELPKQEGEVGEIAIREEIDVDDPRDKAAYLELAIANNLRKVPPNPFKKKKKEKSDGGGAPRKPKVQGVVHKNKIDRNRAKAQSSAMSGEQD